jgi:hypothetical protein
MSTTAWAVLVGVVAGLLAGGGLVESEAATEAELQSAVVRAKPAVVMVAVRIGATATVRCGTGPGGVVRPGAIGELGSGSIVHPDGWIVTNGHVIQPYQEGADGAFAAELLEKSIASACAAELDGLPSGARTQRIQAFAASPENRRGLAIERSLEVHLSNGKSYAAEVKFYSPPAYVVVGTTREGAGAPRSVHGRDVAILKIEDRELPVVRLARHSTDLHLGQLHEGCHQAVRGLYLDGRPIHGRQGSGSLAELRRGSGVVSTPSGDRGRQGERGGAGAGWNQSGCARSASAQAALRGNRLLRA